MKKRDLLKPSVNSARVFLATIFYEAEMLICILLRNHARNAKTAYYDINDFEEFIQGILSYAYLTSPG